MKFNCEPQDAGADGCPARDPPVPPPYVLHGHLPGVLHKILRPGLHIHHFIDAYDPRVVLRLVSSLVRAASSVVFTGTSRVAHAMSSTDLNLNATLGCTFIGILFEVLYVVSVSVLSCTSDLFL